MFKEYADYDATTLAELIKNKEVTKEEVLAAAIERIKIVNPKLNAVVYEMFEEAQKSIRLSNNSHAPLDGVPFLIKDLGLYLKGQPTSYGSRLLDGVIQKETSEILKRFMNCGLTILGKTNIPELGIMGVTEPKRFGPCRNPWNTNLTPGGSSGGSAAAVAARMVPVASADDGGGSIRIPASACGLFGMKPSRGAYPMGPHKNESWLSLVNVHVVSRTVRDSALIYNLIKGPGLGDAYGTTKPLQESPVSPSLAIQAMKGKRVAFTKKSLLGVGTSSECLKAQEDTLQSCRELGMEVVEATPHFNRDEVLMSYFTIVAASVAGEIDRLEKQLGRKATLDNIEHSTLFLKVAGNKLTAKSLESAIYISRQLTLILENFFTEYDYFCTPTMAYEPSAIGLMDLGLAEKMGIRMSPYLPTSVIINILAQIGERGMEKTPNTAIFNMSGHPAMSVPTYMSKDHLPIGTQFVGRMSEDHSLFQLAFALEEKYRWDQLRPNI